MRTEQLRYFLTTVQFGSFSKAAGELNISASALRESMDSLESELGVQLLERSKQGIILTDKGRALFNGLQHIYDSYLALLSDANNVELLREQKHFQLSVQYSYMAYLNTLYQLLKANYHDYSVLISHEDSIRTQYEHLLERNCDLAVFSRINTKDKTATDYVGFSREKQITVVPFYQDGISAMMKKSHPLAKKTELHSSDLENELLVYVTTNSPTKEYIQTHIKKQPVFISVPNMSMAETYMQEQNGIVFLPKRFEQSLKSNLVAIPLAPEIYITHYAAYRTNDIRYITQSTINYLKIMIQQTN